MKNKILVGVIICLSFCLVGCNSSKSNNNVVVNTCVLSKNDTTNGYNIDSTYKIYSKNKEVQKVVTKEIVTSEKKEVLTYFESFLNKTYKATNKKYGGYTFNVKNENNTVTSSTTIDYNKMNFKKYVKDNSQLKAYINKNSKLTTEGAKKIYTSLGATCK